MPRATRSCFSRPGDLQIGRGHFPGDGVADGVLGVLIIGADVYHIDVASQLLNEPEGILVFVADALGGENDLQGIVRAQRRSKLFKQGEDQPCTVLPTAAPTVGAVIAFGRPEFVGNVVVIGAVDAEHIKAKPLEIHGVFHGGIDVVPDALLGDPADVVAHDPFPLRHRAAFRDRWGHSAYRRRPRIPGLRWGHDYPWAAAGATRTTMFSGPPGHISHGHGDGIGTEVMDLFQAGENGVEFLALLVGHSGPPGPSTPLGFATEASKLVLSMIWEM